jgi:predicted kinase
MDVCSIRTMRDWWREIIMRRRGKRAPNNSEQTGKIGQELPQGQLAPLRPSYHESAPTPKAESTVLAEPQGRLANAEDFDADFDGDGDAGERFDEQGEGLPVDDEPGGSLVHETQPESPSTPPPAAQATSPREPRGFVVLTIGLPGSGKTTWFKRRAVQPLSSDMLRSILFDDITEQRYQGLVFSTLRSLLRARLIAKMPWNYVDATNLSPHERRQWIKMAKSFGYDVHAVFFDVPFEVCMDRNRRRERVVSEDVMQKMAERLRPPSFKEGFSKITVVRVKGSGPSTSVAPAGSPDDLSELE